MTAKPEQTDSPRPFRVLGVQQIAFGSTDRKRLRALWVNHLGLTPHGSYQSANENVDEEILLLGEGPRAVEVDLMQPLDPDKKPDVRTPALNHIGLWVDNLELAYQWLGSRGVRFAPGGIRKGAAGHDVCFIHPKANDAFPLCGEGALIELVQAPGTLLSEEGS